MKKIFSVIILTIIMFCTTGCSFKGCINCVGSNCKELVACSLEKSAGCNDFFNFLTCVEDCTDFCYVAPCYHMANCTRKCTLTSKGKSCLRTNLEKVTDKCNVNFNYNVTRMYNLDNYYKVEVTVTVETIETIKDVLVVFNIRDANNNKLNNYELYINSKIAEGPYKAKSAEATFIFTHEENYVSLYDVNYYVNLEVVNVYGRL